MQASLVDHLRTANCSELSYRASFDSESLAKRVFRLGAARCSSTVVFLRQLRAGIIYSV